MTIGEKCCEAFRKAKADGKTLSLDEVRFMIDDAVAAAGKPAKPAKKKPMNSMTQDEFLAYLKTAPEFQNVNIDYQLVQCEGWCRRNGRKFTRRTLCNWLAKEDREVVLKKAGYQVATGKQLPPAPADWREKLEELFPGNKINQDGRGWGDLTDSVREQIIENIQPQP